VAVNQKVRIAATLVLINLVLVTGVRVLASFHPPSTNLRNLLRDAGCPASCWQGIQPTTTTRAVVLEFLGDEGLGYSISRSAGKSDAYVWQLERSNPLTNPSDAASVIVEFDTQDVVWRVAMATLDICFSSVLDAFGIPPLADGDDHILRLGYPQDGLVFGIDLDKNRVNALFITTDEWVNYFTRLDTPPRWNRLIDHLTTPCVDRLSGTQTPTADNS
jgi:hypothetical protein